MKINMECFVIFRNYGILFLMLGYKAVAIWDMTQRNKKKCGQFLHWSPKIDIIFIFSCYLVFRFLCQWLHYGSVLFRAQIKEYKLGSNSSVWRYYQHWRKAREKPSTDEMKWNRIKHCSDVWAISRSDLDSSKTAVLEVITNPNLANNKKKKLICRKKKYHIV